MSKLAKILKDKKVAVVKTDTLYGLLGLANSRSVVDRIYKIKGRDSLKPVIVLIADIDQISDFCIEMGIKMRERLNDYWPGPNSIVLPVRECIELHHLHKGTGGISFRIPDDEYLLDLLSETGPLVAPSANPEGQTPAKNIKEAMNYFGSDVEYYDDRGHCDTVKPSRVIKLKEILEEEIIRE